MQETKIETEEVIADIVIEGSVEIGHGHFFRANSRAKSSCLRLSSALRRK